MFLVALTLKTPKMMDHYTHFAGIDVSKHTLDVMLWQLDQGTLGKTACQTSNQHPETSIPKLASRN